MNKIFKTVLNQEDINFLLTNRLPRNLLTRFIGWFSEIEQPLIRNISIATWKIFSDLDLSEAKKTRFSSMHDCFIRELKDGVRPIDHAASTLVSPCDAIVGAHGLIEDTTLYQAKSFPYTLEDLLGECEDIEHWRGGTYITLRLTSSMYHRFHAPHDCHVEQVTYFSGDTWNVNPIALRRIEKLFCKNERAYIKTTLTNDNSLQDFKIALVPVAAILVASMRFHFLDVLLHLKYKGPNIIACDASFDRGQEMGWFQHGSTIIVLAPKGFDICKGLQTGSRIRMGQKLLYWTGS